MYPSSTDSFSHLTSSIHGCSHSYPPNNLFTQTDLVQGFFFTSNAVNQTPPENPNKKSITICKKDRHSKIYTAHGPRDRRVRLSMDIAWKFFDLQDMLGFDKPSKTLDWLLTSSKESIKELVNMKMKTNNYTSNSTTSGCLFDMVYNTNNNEKMMRDAFDLSSRESRAKARERARDRTREKMRARSLKLIKGQDLITNPNHQSCSRSWLQNDHIPDIWDMNTDLIPPEVEYHGKYWDDDKYSSYTIRED